MNNPDPRHSSFPEILVFTLMGEFAGFAIAVLAVLAGCGMLTAFALMMGGAFLGFAIGLGLSLRSKNRTPARIAGLNSHKIET